MTVLLAPATTLAQSDPFTPGVEPLSIYITPADGVNQTTSANVIFVERQTTTGWQRVLTLNGEGDGDGIVFLAKGTFRFNRPLQGSATGVDIIGTYT